MIGVGAAVIAAVFAILTTKEGRDWTCRTLVEIFERPYFCDCDATTTLVAFRYTHSAGGVSAADACLAGNPPLSVNGTSSQLHVDAVSGTAVCVDITLTHTQLSKGVRLPVTVSVQVPSGLYQDPETRLVRLVTDPAGSESDVVQFDDSLRLGPGTVSRSRRRLFVVGGDVADWPSGHYVATITAEGLVSKEPIRAELDVERP